MLTIIRRLSPDDTVDNLEIIIPKRVRHIKRMTLKKIVTSLLILMAEVVADMPKGTSDGQTSGRLEFKKGPGRSIQGGMNVIPK